MPQSLATSGAGKFLRQTWVSSKTKYVHELFDSFEKAGEKKNNLQEMIEKYDKKPKALCKVARDDLKLVVDETKPFGDFLVKLVEGKYSFSETSHKIYWARILCEAATELEDPEGLLAVLKLQDITCPHRCKKSFTVDRFFELWPTS